MAPALFTRMSTSGNVWNTRSRAEASARSAASVRTLTPVSLAIAAPSFSRRSPERATRQTLTPSRANHCATASPMPFELPVTSAVRPVSFKSIGIPLEFLPLCHAEFCRPCPLPVVMAMTGLTSIRQCRIGNRAYRHRNADISRGLPSFRSVGGRRLRDRSSNFFGAVGRRPDSRHGRRTETSLRGTRQRQSGGYRTVSYFAGADVPVLLLALIDKSERADLSEGERRELRKELAGYASDYRA